MLKIWKQKLLLNKWSIVQIKSYFLSIQIKIIFSIRKSYTNKIIYKIIYKIYKNVEVPSALITKSSLIAA